MKIKLSIPEFIVAIFNLDPTQCRLSFTGRIANLNGFAYQIQSLLFEHIKLEHISYRSSTVKLCSETSEHLVESPSREPDRFSIETFIDALKEINPKPSNLLVASFGKDPAWSWQWPSIVFVIGMLLFYIFNWFFHYFISLSGCCLGMVLTGLLFIVFGTRPIRFAFEKAFFRCEFKTSLSIQVVQAEIFKKLKELPPEEKKLGVIPTIIKRIEETNNGTTNHTIEKLLEDLEQSQLNLKTATSKIAELTTKKKELEGEIEKLRSKNKTLQNEKNFLDTRLTDKVALCTDLEIARDTLTKSLNEEKNSHTEEVKKLKEENTNLKKTFTENETKKKSIILFGIISYIKKEAKISQEEISGAFHETYLEQKQNKRYPRLQRDTVNDCLAKNNAYVKSIGIKEEWFYDRRNISEKSKKNIL